MVDFLRLLTKIRKYDSFGRIAIASLLICTLTGVFLIIPYDPSNAYTSVTSFVVSNKAAALMRNLHYWSAQFFLVCTILHFFEHLMKDDRLNRYTLNDRRIKDNGIWLRLVITLPVVFYIMLTGFILKNDADSRQAHALMQTLFGAIPLAGKYLSSFLAGNTDNLLIPYLHHAATGTIITFLVVYEHVRNLRVRHRTFIITSLVIIGLSLFFQAPLSRLEESVMKGPWFFAGIQELLHLLQQPLYVVLWIVALLVIIGCIPFGGKQLKVYLTRSVYLITGIYIVLSISGYFFRGPAYVLQLPWSRDYRLPVMLVYNPLPVSADKNDGVVLTGEGAEGCMSCHSKVTGLSVSHNISTTGCYACHRGNWLTLNADEAHRSMIRVPGTLQNASVTCGGTACHGDIVDRVSGSLMATLNGMFSVDKWVFGEAESPDGHFHVNDLGNSAADSHLKNLCAGCHLGMDKQQPGAAEWLGRGGGCLACHLEYKPAALKSLQAMNDSSRGKLLLPEARSIAHPSIDVNITNNRCESCHSRSGRISMSYEGWHETQLKEMPFEAASAKSKEILGGQYRQLPDGRIFIKQPADIHHQAGMLCIDCHTSMEVMGDGNHYLHKEEAVKVVCTDCHPPKGEPFLATDLSRSGRENQLIAWLRDWSEGDPSIIISAYSARNPRNAATNQAGGPFAGSLQYALVNTRVSAQGPEKLSARQTGQDAFLITRADNKRTLPLKPAAVSCTAKAHKRLECGACHSAWVPQCLGCHNTYEPKTAGFDMTWRKSITGTWVEYAGEMLADPPVLGIKHTDKINGEQTVGTFTPGMIMTIDRSSFNKGKQRGIDKNAVVFHRLYAPVSAHTTQKASRSCVSCHLDPLALGIGRGTLVLQKSGEWIFEPAYALNKTVGLPEDAWTAFFRSSDGHEGESTRLHMRPFSSTEQKRILRVGACLTCHDEQSHVMQSSLTDFEAVLSKATRACIVPRL